MFCSKCGAQNPDDSKFCSSCGAPLALAAAPEAAPAAAAVVAAERTSGMAIAALVTGILGISLLAVIFGGIAISQTNKDPNLKGKGMAIAGLILGILGMIGVVIWFIFAAFWGASLWWWW